MTCFSSFFAIIWQKMKKSTSWKFKDESSVSGPCEFGLCVRIELLSSVTLKYNSIHRAIQKRKIFLQTMNIQNDHYQNFIGTCSVKELVLFGIVILFLICALPRYLKILLLYELFHLY